MPACGASKITVVYSAGGNVLRYKIECQKDACIDSGRQCKEVRLSNPKDAWTKYCACRVVKDGEYDGGTDEPPPADMKCNEGFLALDSEVKGGKREYSVRCLGKCDGDKKCKPTISEKWETVKTENGWEQDIRTVEYTACDCKDE
jgi:hypothetical protein